MATLRAPFASSLQEVSDVIVEGDIAEILESETYANANSLAQTTHTTLGLGVGVGFSIGGASVPAASGLPRRCTCLPYQWHRVVAESFISKRLNVESLKQRHTIAQGLVF